MVPTLRDSLTGNPRTPMMCFQHLLMTGQVTRGITTMKCCEYTRLGGATALEVRGGTGFNSGMPAFGETLTDDEI